MRVDRCNNIREFRSMARRRLPGPIFHYIDGAADDEVTYRRNTEAYERCDLVPNVLAGVESIDMSITVMGQKIDMPLFCAPTALQRLFHHDGERAVASGDHVEALATQIAAHQVAHGGIVVDHQDAVGARGRATCQSGCCLDRRSVRYTGSVGRQPHTKGRADARFALDVNRAAHDAAEDH